VGTSREIGHAHIAVDQAVAENAATWIMVMTLVLNEIHLLEGLERSVIIAAADRRISKLNGSYDSTGRKLFLIPHLQATVSYYGLAHVYPSSKPRYLSDWLPSFVSQQSETPDIASFASVLTERLNRIVPKSILLNQPSGFHISGHNHRSYPEFWHITNVGGLDNYHHVNLGGQYKPPSEDFLRRDAKTLGWDGIDPMTARNTFIYRNGDFRTHVAVSELLDEALQRVMQIPGFAPFRNLASYGDYVKFKLEFIAGLYQRWAKQQNIARPIDVIITTSHRQILISKGNTFQAYEG
jgi:hypothetical protein